jgi:hypothetical protein
MEKVIEKIAQEFIKDNVRNLYFTSLPRFLDTYAPDLNLSQREEIINELSKYPEIFTIDRQNSSIKLIKEGRQLLKKYSGFIGYKNYISLDHGKSSKTDSQTDQRGLGLEFNNVKHILSQGQKHLFVIGIDKYKYLKQLKNAVKDIDAIVQVLLNRYDFDNTHLKVLKDEEATGKNIINTLHHYTKKSVLGEDDSLLIYFAGHGVLDENEEGYWVTVESERDDISSFLANHTVIGKVKNMKCRHVLLISDSCFSGSLLATERDESVYNLVAAELENRKSRWVITSGGHDEKVLDGIGNSPFAEAIIKELQINSKTKLIADELALRVRSVTRANAPQVPQSGRLYASGDALGQFVFHLRDAVDIEQQSSNSTKHIPETDQVEAQERFAEIAENEDKVNKFPPSPNAKKGKDNRWIKWLFAIFGIIYGIPIIISIVFADWMTIPAPPTDEQIRKTALDSILFYQVQNNYIKLFEVLSKNKSVLSSDEEYLLAEMYDYGKGTKQNYPYALWWYKRAAGRGNVNASLRLGLMYHNGTGVEKDYVQAMEWYKSTLNTEQNNIIALYRIGIMYEYGQGVDKNLTEAENYYRSAANQGLENAIKKLAKLGIEPDPLGYY